MPTPLQSLQAWSRPGYYFSVTGGGAKPCVVVLACPARSLRVDDEYASRHTDKTEDFLMLDELVAEALRQWHADPAPKNFVVALGFANEAPEAAPGFSVRTRRGGLECRVVAANEAGAVRLCDARHPGSSSRTAAEVGAFPPVLPFRRTRTAGDQS